jgi:hypothetical protein
LTSSPVAERRRPHFGPGTLGTTPDVEVPYSDSMDARVSDGGMDSRVRDMSTEDLLRTVDVAATVGGTD